MGGVRLGRRPGERQTPRPSKGPKLDSLAPKVTQLVGTGQLYREIARPLKIDKSTLMAIHRTD
jgi:hypothetical protein